MTIIEAFKQQTLRLRLTFGNRWLYYYEGEWIVRERRPRHKKTEVVFLGHSEDEAIRCLTEESY